MNRTRHCGRLLKSASASCRPLISGITTSEISKSIVALVLSRSAAGPSLASSTW
jgi:hypothetical protein